MSKVDEIKRRCFPNDVALAQINKAEREGRLPLEENVTFEAHLALQNRGRWPQGSRYLYAAGMVYGPPADRSKRT